MKLSQLSKVAIAVAAAATFAAPASAIPIVAIFNIAALGTFTADTGDVTTATTITNGAPDVVGAIVGNNIGLVTGQTVTFSPNPMPVTLGGIFMKQFVTPLGTFLETLTVTSVTPTPNALGVLAQGLITQIVGVGFDPTPVFYSAAYTQNQGPGTQINGSFNDSTTRPGGNVPEPATLALLGLGLAGLGFSRRKKA